MTNAANPAGMRLDWLDALKGIAILLVVMGHNAWVIGEHPDQTNVLMLFHMPLFILASGYLLTPNVDAIKRRFRTLVVPYFFTGLVFLPQDVLRPAGSTIPYALEALAAGGAMQMWQAHLWFLPALFSSIVLTVVLLIIPGLKGRPYVQAILAAVLLTSGYFIGGQVGLPLQTSHETLIRVLPWGLDLAPSIAGLILVGLVVRHCLAKRLNEGLTLGAACVLAVLSFVGVELFEQVGSRLDMNERVLGAFWIFPAMLGVALCYFVQEALRHIPMIHRGLCYLGKASLVIYLFHYWLQFLIIKRITGTGSLAVLAIPLVVAACLLIDRCVRASSFLSTIYFPRPKKTAQPAV